MKTKNVIVVAALLMTTASMAMTKNRVGNGGDGKYVDNQLVLRDFTESAEIILDNREFLKSIPDLESLLKDIGRAHPKFALAIAEDLLRANFYISSKKLRLLANEETSLSPEKADEQIAIRNGNDIIIAKSELDKVEQSYLLLHESIHGLLQEEGPFEHTRTRALVRYIKQNRHTLTKDSLTAVLEKVGYYRSENPDSKEMNADVQSGLKMIISGETPVESRCALLSLLKIRYPFMLSVDPTDLEGASFFGDNNTCNGQDSFELFDKLYPSLGKFRSEPYANFLETYQVTNGAPITWRTPKYLKEIYKGHCKKYASQEEEQRLKKNSDILSEAQSSLREIQKGQGAAQNKAEALYANLIVKYQPFSNLGPLGGYLHFRKLAKYQGTLARSWVTFKENVDFCSKL